MTPSEWRALLEALLDGRLSVSAFVRRFMEAWRASRASGLRPPAAIESLFTTLEAYDPDEEGRGPAAPGDDEIIAAVRRARAALQEEGAPAAARTYDRARAREDMRRFQIGVSSIAGVGCALVLVWLGLCLLQIFAVSDQIQSYLDWPAAPATFAGVIIAFIPFVGNIIAFFGARDVWDWPSWLAGIIFFAAPALTLLSAWGRWVRRPRA